MTSTQGKKYMVGCQGVEQQWTGLGGMGGVPWVDPALLNDLP